MNPANSIRHGVTWLFVGSTGSKVLAFGFGIVLARLLAPEDFGMLVTIHIFTGLAGFVSGGGMGQALIRAREATKPDYDIVFTLQILIGCLIYSVFFYAAPWFAEWYDTPLYADLLRISALSFIFRPFVNLPSSILHRNMRYKAKTAVQITTLLVSSTVSISMAYYDYGVWSLIIGGISGSVVGMILLAPLAGWRPGFSLDFRRARNLARYGILVSANDIVVYVRNQAANFILGRTMGAAPVGLFNKADSLSRMPHGLITGSVYQVIFRAMAKEQDDLDKSHYLFFRSLCLVSVYVTPFYLMAHWIADPLITFLYGAKWAGAAAPLAILALAGPFLTIGNMSGAVLAARNWLGKELRVQLILLGLVIIATFSGLPYGLQGVAAALVVVAVYNAMHMYSLAARCLGTNWMQLLIALRPAAILNAIFACTLFLLHHTMPGEVQASDLGYLAAMIITGILVYALCFLFLPISALRSEQERWKTRLRRHGARTP